MKTVFKEIFIVVTLAIAALVLVIADPYKHSMPTDPTGLMLTERTNFFGLQIKIKE